MSARHIKMRKEQAAREAFDRNLERLYFEIKMGTPRRHLDVLLEFLDSLVQETGDNLYTEHYGRLLAEAKRRVSTRTNLRLVRGAPPRTPKP